MIKARYERKRNLLTVRHLRMLANRKSKFIHLRSTVDYLLIHQKLETECEWLGFCSFLYAYESAYNSNYCLQSNTQSISISFVAYGYGNPQSVIELNKGIQFAVEVVCTLIHQFQPSNVINILYEVVRLGAKNFFKHRS